MEGEATNLMAPISQDAWSLIQPGLFAGESICWAGQPNTGVIFHKDDVWMIPLALGWSVTPIIGEAAVIGALWSGHWSPTEICVSLFCTPFAIYAQYLIWGRFLYAAWKKKRTFYAVTSRRVIVVQDGWRRRSAVVDLNTLPSLILENGPNGTGTVRFAKWQTEHQGCQLLGWTRFDLMAIGNVPTLVDVDNADFVYRLVSDLQKKARPSEAELQAQNGLVTASIPRRPFQNDEDFPSVPYIIGRRLRRLFYRDANGDYR